MNRFPAILLIWHGLVLTGPASHI